MEMKNNLKKGIALTMAVVLMLLSLFGCTNASETASDALESNQSQNAEETIGGQQSESNENIELVFWQNHMVTPVEQKLPQEEWTITKIIDEFEKENPGITVTMEMPTADVSAMQQTFKAGAIAGSGPDIIALLPGQALFDLQDAIMPITTLVPQEDKDIISGWDMTTKDGEILAYPEPLLTVNYIFYNRELLAAAGLDFDTAMPKNTDEFMEALEQIKAADILPISTADWGMSWAYTQGFALWWEQISGSDALASDTTGETKFADDAGFIKSLELAAEMYENGYINEDYATTTEDLNRFLQGESALYISGNWDINDLLDAMGDNVGVCALPMASEAQYEYENLGCCSRSFAVSSYCKYPEAAIKFISFLCNKQNTITLIQNAQPKAPARSDISIDELGWTAPIFEQAISAANNLVSNPDYVLNTEVLNELYKQTTLVILGKLSAAECAEKLDKVVQEVLND